MARVLVVGGHGAFGQYISRRLAEQDRYEVIVGGRSPNATAAFANALSHASQTRAKIEHTSLDARTCSPADLRRLAPDVLINASGPFQHHDQSLARAAIVAKCHYIDLADDRDFVCQIDKLDTGARANKVCVISGASSVPGLSSAVVANFKNEFKNIATVEIGISPGNRYTPGIATTRSILSYVGNSFTITGNGRPDVAYGWQNLSRHTFPQLGKRFMCSVNVPDLELFPRHDKTLKTVTMKAGLELSTAHLGLYALSWLPRTGLIKSLEPLAPVLFRIKKALEFLGTDSGGMFVKLNGHDNEHRTKSLTWHLIARSGHGPHIPTLAATILTDQLCRADTPNAQTPLKPGARPCFKVVNLADFEKEIASRNLDVTTSTTLQPV